MTGRGENSASDSSTHISAQANSCKSCPQTHPYSPSAELDLCVQENQAQASKQDPLMGRGLKIVARHPVARTQPPTGASVHTCRMTHGLTGHAHTRAHADSPSHEPRALRTRTRTGPCPECTDTPRCPNTVGIKHQPFPAPGGTLGRRLEAGGTVSSRQCQAGGGGGGGQLLQEDPGGRRG